MNKRELSELWHEHQLCGMPILRLDGFDVGTCWYCGALVPLHSYAVETHLEWHSKYPSKIQDEMAAAASRRESEDSNIDP